MYLPFPVRSACELARPRPGRTNLPVASVYLCSWFHFLEKVASAPDLMFQSRSSLVLSLLIGSPGLAAHDARAPSAQAALAPRNPASPTVPPVDIPTAMQPLSPTCTSGRRKISDAPARPRAWADAASCRPARPARRGRHEESRRPLRRNPPRRPHQVHPCPHRCTQRSADGGWGRPFRHLRRLGRTDRQRGRRCSSMPG